MNMKKPSQIKLKYSSPRYWLSLSIALSLTLFFVVNYWQYIKNLQAGKQTVSNQYLSVVDRFVSLNKKNGFFSARFDGCHKLKLSEICQAFYPVEKSTQHQPLISENDIKNAIRRQKINQLPQLSYGRALKVYQNLSTKTKFLIQKSLNNQETCFPVNLYAAAGVLSENNFPSRSAIEISERNYLKALECDLKDDQVLNAEYGIYRLALISYWQKNYKQSEKALQSILKYGSDVEFQSRASFWSLQIKKINKQKIDEIEMIQSFTQFPVQYHSIQNFSLLNENKAFELIAEKIPSQLEPQSMNPSINNSLQIYRELMRRNEINLAMRVLEFLSSDQLYLSEPDVQLYFAKQMNQSSKFNHQKFQLLSKLFAQYPRYKTIENLKIFYPLEYGSIIYKASQHADPYLIFGLIRQESSFNTFAESPVGARGLMQIMPRTAQEIRPGVQLDSLKIPSINVQMGSRYIHALIREFQGDVHKALAAYNAGAGNVRRWSKKYPFADGLLFADLIPYEETREYVSNILRNRYWYQKLYPVIQDEENIAQKSTDDL